jgi:hypothetical protein
MEPESELNDWFGDEAVFTRVFWDFLVRRKPRQSREKKEKVREKKRKRKEEGEGKKKEEEEEGGVDES